MTRTAWLSHARFWTTSFPVYTYILQVIRITYLQIAIHQFRHASNAVCNVQAKNAIFLRTSSCLTCFRGKHRSIVQSASVQSFAREHISSLHNQPKYNRVSEIFQLHSCMLLHCSHLISKGRTPNNSSGSLSHNSSLCAEGSRTRPQWCQLLKNEFRRLQRRLLSGYLQKLQKC